MRASLFFAMVREGRVLAFRRRMSDYVEQCKINAFHRYTPTGQRELMQYYFDSSMSARDWATREQTRKTMNDRAAQNYTSTTEALEFFRTTSRRQAK